MVPKPTLNFVPVLTSVYVAPTLENVVGLGAVKLMAVSPVVAAAKAEADVYIVPACAAGARARRTKAGQRRKGFPCGATPPVAKISMNPWLSAGALVYAGPEQKLYSNA